jgi:hypothetical protein
MNNYDIAHKFFYDLDGYFSKHYMNVSYSNYKYYSYYTIIGKVIEDIDGNYLLLVSEDNFSNTTAKHINNLLGACPFNNRMYVPVNYGDSDIYVDKLEEKIVKKLEIYKKSKLALKENREKYCRYYTMLCEISHKIVKVKKSVIAKYRGLYLELQDINKVKELKKKQRLQDNKENERIEKEFQKLIKAKNLDELKKWLSHNWSCDKKLYKKVKNYINEKTVENLTNNKNLLEIINSAYNYNSNLNWGDKQLLQEFLKSKYEKFSFVWIEDDKLKTSQYVIVKVEDCKTLIRLYKHGKIKHGMQLNQYTILEVKNDYIKIGCHKILRENIDLLINGF